MTDVRLPDIGDFEEVEIIEVLVSAGDEIAAEDSVVTLETDKASMEIPSPYSGVVSSVAVNVGDRISQGALLLNMEVSDVEAATPTPEVANQEPAPATEEPEAASVPPPAASLPSVSRPAGEKIPKPEPVAHQPAVLSGDKAHASPAIRRFARELGVTIARVSGSGSKGRVTREDVQEYIKQAISGGGTAASPGAGAGIPSLPAVDFSRFGEIEEVPMSKIKKISGAHLHGAWLNIPHVTQFDEADITGLEAFRKAEKDAAAKQDVRLTFMPFLLKAVAASLQAFPEFNSSLSADGASLIMKKYLNIGVAVDTPNGLVVPVIKDVDKKGVIALAEELMQISAKARDGKLAPGDMQGGCISISSLGGIGGTQFTPIVNAPEVAILGVSRAAMKPVWDGKEFAPRLIMPFSLSYDHRVIDGAQGVRFTTYLSGLLADIRKLVM